MAKPKLYNSAEWLRAEYTVKLRKIEDLAAQCNVSVNTIRNALKKANLL